MNELAIVAIGSMFFAVMAVFMSLFPRLVTGANRYQQNFEETADTTFTEMFVFIDPKKIYMINISIIVVVFLLFWLVFDMLPIAIILSVILGFAPRFLYKFLINRRRKQFLHELPDTLQSMAGMMKSGSNLNLALETMVDESDGPIAQEFGLLLREFRIGVPFAEALDNLYERMPIDELRLVTSAMKISREIGGSLADIFEKLGVTLRRKIEMEGKIKALTAQGKMQGIVMTGLPFIIGFALFQFEEEAMSKLWTDPYGWGVCAFCAVFTAIGYFFIRKIVNIDV
ncbi:MAG: type II secretion system F family protein [Pseudomonadales bacterium]|nr:type II secretion system F family protein [Pseudomonadales bacterium]